MELHRRKVYIVEDNDMIADFCIKAFKKHNVRNDIMRFVDGQDVLDYMFVQIDDKFRYPELILLDLMLPAVSGFDVLKKIRSDSRFRMIPIVIFTSSCSPANINEAYSLGANSFVRKPLEFQQFLDVIEQITKYWLTTNKTE